MVSSQFGVKVIGLRLFAPSKEPLSYQNSYYTTSQMAWVHRVGWNTLGMPFLRPQKSR